MDSTPDIFGRAFQIRTKERLLRDPVHGLIPIDENTPEGRLIVDLVNSAEMQRLRRIRQLGMAHYAFPGAEHSRFTHSIGAFHLTRLVVGQLSRMYAIDSELAFMASVGALLHDLGHGPFSHVAERILGTDHEAWTLRILHDSRCEVNEILSRHSRRLPSMIESILIGMAKPGYLSSLLSSELDADRLDYLLRDSLMTGVKYGVYDLDRLLHMFRISPDGERLIIAHGGLVPVEKYVQARYHMHRQVYLHKTVVAAEGMLASLLRRAAILLREGKDAGLSEGDVVAKALHNPAALDTPDYLQLDDVEILARIKQWARGGDPILSDLSDRLLRRRLFKTLEIDPMDADFESRWKAANDAVQSAGFDPEYYLLRIESHDTPYRPYDPKAEKISQHIWIEDGDGKIVDVAQLSPTIQAFTHSGFTATRAAFPNTPDHSLRAKLKEIFKA